MIEIERKYRLTAKQATTLARELERQFGTPEHLHQIDEVFLFQKNSFANHQKGDPVIRLRNQNGKASFTLKKATGNAGSSVEHELAIGSHETMRAALVEMGYQTVISIEKKRHQYSGNGVTYELDDVTGLGMFLEIEILAEQTDHAAEQKILEAATDLGLSDTDLEPKKYDVLLEEQHQRSKRQTN
jgi:adenylate cyclase class 2